MTIPVLSDSLQSYLIQINQFPLLSKEEEFHLAVRYRKYNDLSAAHKLVTSNLRFVVKIALEYRGYIVKHTEHAIKLTDLIQEGNIGLMKAVKKFDPYKGFRLITYAVWWIRAQIQQFILKTLSIVKKSTSELRDRLFSQLKATKKAIDSIEGKDMCLSEGPVIEVEEVDSYLVEQKSSNITSDLYYTSLDKDIGDEGETTLIDTISDPSSNQEEDLAVKEEKLLIKQRLRMAFKSLNPKERMVITDRFLNDEPLTLQEVGNKLGITRERVRQIECKALKKLKKSINQNSLPYDIGVENI